MDETFMLRALAEARQAGEEEEIPVGAVIAFGEQMIASAHNQREALRDPTAHAEMLAITQAADFVNSWRLTNCTLYVTLEPCPMCAGAIINARIPRVVYGTADTKTGAVDSLFRLLGDARLNHRAEIVRGVLADECSGLLTSFFAKRRRKTSGPDFT